MFAIALAAKINPRLTATYPEYSNPRQPEDTGKPQVILET